MVKEPRWLGKEDKWPQWKDMTQSKEENKLDEVYKMVIKKPKEVDLIEPSWIIL